MPQYLGPKESEVIARLTYEKVSIITNEQFNRLFGKLVLTRQVIYQLKKKGILKPITRGVYYFSPLEAGPDGTRINEFLIPPVLFPKGNYYVGYSMMYNYYGFTEQIFQTFYVLNTSLQRERIISGVSFKLLKVSPCRMYGLTKIKIQNSEVLVSDRERTLVDLVYFPDPIGSLKNVFEIIKKQVSNKDTNIKRLISYALKFPGISTRKRIGYFLEKCGVSNALLSTLMRSIRNTALITLYASKSRKGTINPQWRIIIDDAQ